jgi:hypothetical protein
MSPVLATLFVARALACGACGCVAAAAVARAQDTVPTLRARAVRATAPILVDGREDDAVWGKVQPTRGFRQYYPQEDGTPTVETQFKVAYDDQNLYVFVRAFDPHPDSIMHAVTRRDTNSPSDVIGITIDGFHDRRTGYEFAVNPDGVKKDCAVYADTLFDWFWDGVWDAAARVDSLGWSAEFRIPFSQIRYADVASHTFGLAVWRTSYRFNESSIWPLWRGSRGGLMHQLGELTGVDDIAAPHSLAIVPYTLTSNASRRTIAGYDRAQRSTFGSDLKYVIAPNMTLNATINPDFGQVEADPSVLNLTTAETFYPEQRPFFREGSKLYELDMGCNVTACAGEGLFYSRRIGRAPQLLATYGDANSPAATPIAVATKLTGRTDGGLSVAVLDAVTEHVGGAQDRTIEPATNYAVVRATQEAMGGRSALGVTATAVDRSLDASTQTLLRHDAYVGAIDVRQRLGDSPYGFTASLTESRIDGSRQAIAATQLAPTHDYQRPDGSLVYDSTRTSLSGDAEEIAFGKYQGRVQFLTAWQRHSAGLEVNDLGFMQRSDLQTLSLGASTTVRTPHSFLRYLSATAGWARTWTTDWLQIGNTLTGNVTTLLTNNWSITATANATQLPGTFCDNCARGGPAIRQDAAFAPSLSIAGDGRRSLVPSMTLATTAADDGRTHSSTVSPGLTLHLSPRAQASVGASFARNHDHTQWYGNFAGADGQTHYGFAVLDQRTLSLTTRGSFAVTPDLTLEMYGAPFATSGAYSDTRELSATPRAASYDARFVPFAPPNTAAKGFDVRQLRSDLVARWEYKPGSTLFVVWTHGRDGSDAVPTGLALRDDYGRIFGAHPDNTFLVKMSYWLSR